MAEPVLSVHGLRRSYGDLVALDDLTFDVPVGLTGFVGANGAGKTTAIKMLIGLSRPTSGEAEVAGFEVSRHPERVKRNIGYMSQRFSLYADLTVRQNIRFYGGVYGLTRERIRAKTAEIVEELDLADYVDRDVGALPLGWRQRLAFAVAGVHEPGIIFLDEPTGGVDPATRRQFWEALYAKAADGVTIFVTTHYMDEAEYCDRVSIMVEGKIAALGTPAELKDQFGAPSMDGVFVELVRPDDGFEAEAGHTGERPLAESPLPPGEGDPSGALEAGPEAGALEGEPRSAPPPDLEAGTDKP